MPMHIIVTQCAIFLDILLSHKIKNLGIFLNYTSEVDLHLSTTNVELESNISVERYKISKYKESQNSE